MTGLPIVTHFSTLGNHLPRFLRKSRWPPQADLHTLWTHQRLPKWVIDSAPAMRHLDLLGPLPWQHFPERDLQRNWGQSTIPYAAFAAACLLQLNEHLVHMSDLRDYLIEHPAFIWLFGFPLVPDRATPYGFDPEASLPTQRHFTRLLRTMPNATLKFLLAASVAAILKALADAKCAAVAQTISLDTKHIIAWVKENNPKAYVKVRYDKTKQPKGDPDCRLGCKRKTNQVKGKEGVESLPTPTTNPVPAKRLAVGEYYWGYGSGVVATKVPGWGEVVLAELTQPFDRSDVSYFAPLMAEVERRLGRRPRFGALDAAFDAFYTYEYFDDAGGFAAVPFVDRGGRGKRAFDEDGAPLCAAGLPMTLHYTFRSRKALIPHEKNRYACPLFHPEPTGEPCPIDHKNWAKNGCTTTMAASKGARLRYQIDRESEPYKQVYKQRTAVERINSQAVDLGIERPKLRNGLSIANHNTLTYVLINLHALKRIRQRLAKRSLDGTAQERA